MPGKLKVMCVHGLGDQRNKPWRKEFEDAVRDAYGSDPSVQLDFRFVTYDDIFAADDPSGWDWVEAVWKLGWSGLGSLFRRSRAPSLIPDTILWTAGYVVAWVSDNSFQAASRKRVLDEVADYQPDVVLAHSLGSLVTYNAFGHPDAKTAKVAAALKRVTYVTLGSQLANRFVEGNLTGGRIRPLPVRRWRHLYNRHDDVFTAQIKLVPDQRDYRQLETPFDWEGLDHSVKGYLTHENARSGLWAPLAAETDGAKGLVGLDARLADTVTPNRVPKRRARTHGPSGIAARRAPRRRALIVGINDYPDPKQRLEGCVNDAFTISSVLQECGFGPDDIRLCLDHRATAEGILERLEWLVDSPMPGDELVFYFSGHGARMPEYGPRSQLEPSGARRSEGQADPDEIPTHHVEMLCPVDFDWTLDSAITDKQIFSMYSQLPWDTRLVLIFDCCHSGGVHRDGAARARGVTPPDDIRHRELEWNRRERMWVEREFQPFNADFTPDPSVAEQFMGRNLATERLGRASAVRRISRETYDAARKADPDEVVGPYLPLIIEACGEDQLSYEYRHGATSYGVFTWCLAEALRDLKGDVSFKDLVEREVKLKLERLKYPQTPQVLGPTDIVNARTPWRPADTPPGARTG